MYTRGDIGGKENASFLIVDVTFSRYLVFPFNTRQLSYLRKKTFYTRVSCCALSFSPFVVLPFRRETSYIPRVFDRV